MKILGSRRQRRPPVQVVDVRPVPSQAVCSECGQTYPVDPPSVEAEWCCPRCGPSFALDHPSWHLGTPPARTIRRTWLRPLPIFAFLLMVSLLPLLIFLALQLSQVRWSSADLRRPMWEHPTRVEDRTRRTDTPPRRATTRSESSASSTEAIVEYAASAVLRPDPSADSPLATDLGDVTLGQLLQRAGTRDSEEFRLNCRFVRTIKADPSWRVGLSAGGVQRPTIRLELLDSADHVVSQSFVAQDSQAEQIVPWLLEGDWLEIVGTIVIRLDRPTRPPIRAFLIHKIRPASRER